VPFLIQLLLPIYDNDGQPIPHPESQQVRRELSEQFGGVTAYTRAPAEGRWEDAGGRMKREDVVVLEVMAHELDRSWWGAYAEELAHPFKREDLVVRPMAFEPLTAQGVSTTAD
jgi:hypothetical protein